MLRFGLVNGAAVGLGAVVATSCIGVDYPLVAFICEPRQENNCPETHFCCSDDPAAPGGVLPDYVGKGIGVDDDPAPSAAPFFSGANNSLSTSGMCVRVSDIPGQGLMEPTAVDCPIPCNPTWEESWIRDVCGETRVCCQTVAMEAADCVQGSDGAFRPVTGADIPALTSWTPGQHATHQDPNGDGCLGLAGGSNTSPVFADCVAQLSVANQRGFCMSLGANQTCPTAQPGFIDACTQRNGGGAPPA
ncbi:MAG: hypothetical protein K0V04_40080 [Deltaproteobacteria bacterium]|nr:hypothetical protein [Deltaproteobacteria bacterium]